MALNSKVHSGLTDAYSFGDYSSWRGNPGSPQLKDLLLLAISTLITLLFYFASLFGLPHERRRRGYAIGSFATQVPTVSFQVRQKYLLKPGRSITKPKSEPQVRRIEFAFLLTGLVSLILVSLYGCHQQDHASSSA